MADVSVLYDRESRTLTVWFSDPRQEHICEETGDEVILMKDSAGRVIGFEKRMSETLEAMARALFMSWFVDFDPVRAKAEGRDPGLPNALADLFPAGLVDSELGEIPEGWEVTTIGELAEIVGGSTPRTTELEYWQDGLHDWATPKDLSGSSTPVLLDTERRITGAGLSQISSGLLPVGTMLLSSRAPIGYRAIAEVSVAINQGFIAIKPRRGMSNLFMLLWTRIRARRHPQPRQRFHVPRDQQGKFPVDTGCWAARFGHGRPRSACSTPRIKRSWCVSANHAPSPPCGMRCSRS